MHNNVFISLRSLLNMLTYVLFVLLGEVFSDSYPSNVGKTASLKSVPLPAPIPVLIPSYRKRKKLYTSFG